MARIYVDKDGKRTIEVANGETNIAIGNDGVTIRVLGQDAITTDPKITLEAARQVVEAKGKKP